MVLSIAKGRREKEVYLANHNETFLSLLTRSIIWGMPEKKAVKSSKFKIIVMYEATLSASQTTVGVKGN